MWADSPVQNRAVRLISSRWYARMARELSQPRRIAGARRRRYKVGANITHVLVRGLPGWRRLARRTPEFLREYSYLLTVTVWMVAAAIVTVLAGLWLDMTVGRGPIYHALTMQIPPPPTPAQHAEWTARMLLCVALPSLALAPLGPIILRPVAHAPKRGHFILGAGMLLTTLMVYGQQWHTTFCSPHGCSSSGLGPLDAIGRSPLYRLAPAEIYTMHQTVVALLTCFVLVAVLLIGHDVVAGRPISEPPDDSRATIEAAIDAELNTWKVNEPVFGWHDTGVFDGVSDTGDLQATGYRIFAVDPRATAKLPGIDRAEDEDEREPLYPRHFPSYDFTHSHE